jgi:hypothetical protein
MGCGCKRGRPKGGNPKDGKSLNRYTFLSPAQLALKQSQEAKEKEELEKKNSPQQ